MPLIVATSKAANGAIPVTETTLDGSDSLIYTRGGELTLRNPTGGALSPVIDGDGGGNLNVDGLGVVDLSAGYALGSIAAGDVITVKLDTIKAYLAGAIAINSGTALIATLLNV
jgi:hypothetical protein